MDEDMDLTSIQPTNRDKEGKDEDDARNDAVFQKLDEQDVNQLCKVHRLIFANFSPLGLPSFARLNSGFYEEILTPRDHPGSKKNAKKSQPVRQGVLARITPQDHLHTFELCYATAATLLRASGYEGDSYLDDEAMVSHLVQAKNLLAKLSYQLKRQKEQQEKEKNAKLQKKKGKVFEDLEDISLETNDLFSIHTPLIQNFYTKVDAEEISLTLRPLVEFHERIKELLSEFPGNAVLLQIAGIIVRITALPTSSPIMKVLSGLQFLLTKAEMWESSTAKLYSILRTFKLCKIGN